MPLIRFENGAAVAASDEGWRVLEAEEAIPAEGRVILPFQRLAEVAGAPRGTQLGIALEPADNPLALQPWLARLALITVAFPRYTDGRGFSQAALLRRRMGWTGELRAVGHVLRDQAMQMARCGFSTLETSRAAAGEIAASAAAFPFAYQPAADGRASIFQLRHPAGAR